MSGHTIAAAARMSDHTPVWQNEPIALYHADFLRCLLPSESVDLIVTSPPYNLGVGYGCYDDSGSYERYLAFSRAWLQHAFRLLKDDGRLCLNIPLDTTKGGTRSVTADLTTVAKGIGYGYRSSIIWNEGTISRRSAWGSYRSASSPAVITPVEVIVVLYKEHWKKQRRGVSDITPQEFITWTNGLWSFPGESRKRIRHPAPFPLELPHRCLKLFSYVGDTVLDPFVGSGTTLLSALRLRRQGIGIEIDPTYVAIAQGRLRKGVELLAGAGNPSAVQLGRTRLMGQRIQTAEPGECAGS